MDLKHTRQMGLTRCANELDVRNRHEVRMTSRHLALAPACVVCHFLTWGKLRMGTLGRD